MTRDEMREMLARAIADDDGTYDQDELIDLVPGVVIDGATDEVEFWSIFASKADAVLAAIESTGHAIVPREPTEEMVKAGRGHLGSYMRDGTPHDGPLTPAVVYRAMLTACGQEGKS